MTSRLPEVIRRYAEVADAVNHREMRRFVEEIARRWRPPPHEEDYRHEGWTHEGAFTRCIYQEALRMSGGGRCLAPGATEAEVNEQIQIDPSLEDIMEFVDEPLMGPPLPADRRRLVLENIKSKLAQQAKKLGVDASNLQLPKDLESLYSAVNGVNGAGVPSETCCLEVFLPRDERTRPTTCHTRCFFVATIYYVLTVPKRRAKIIPPEAKWMVWDQYHAERDEYNDLTAFLKHETRHVQESEGGARQEVVVFLDRYPNWPVHPATVHFPLAFLSLSFTLDILAHTQPSLPTILSTSSLLSPSTIHTTSYSLLALGLLASIPTILSGVQQAILSISKQGLFEPDGKTIKKKNKVLISHAIGNDLAVAASTWLWWVRSTEVGNVTPKGWMVWAEIGVVGLLFASASGGGSLVYNYGMGFSSLKTAKTVQGKKTS
ncbi:hypothetical protein TI39_contig1039g00005 [Zymoseptoria brevis]|uniref:DUF2231 domain-containing protein n=1 Tax=Zymoseptoria brevis TaxID=1047168 RepID=A0A0F4GEN4_9PEZI|nr:hypothetical protein TI39_contig1039g00005 [Zymoseptoria brevis]